VHDLKILNLFTPLPIHFRLNLNTNTERVNSLNDIIYGYFKVENSLNVAARDYQKSYMYCILNTEVYNRAAITSSNVCRIGSSRKKSVALTFHLLKNVMLNLLICTYLYVLSVHNVRDQSVDICMDCTNIHS